MNPAPLAEDVPAMPATAAPSSPVRSGLRWHRVCALADIPPWCGVAALFGDRQVAILRWGEAEELYALANFDPFSKAMVISRGIVGDCKGEPTVASPVYKQRFRLRDGGCVDDPAVRLPAYPVRVAGGEVEVCLMD